jgi:ABC-type branched-subunit amino acid transport system ATPase component
LRRWKNGPRRPAFISDLFCCARLTADRSGQPVLKDASLTVSAGEIVAITGRNGAGKTTLLEAIAGIIPVRASSLSLEGRPFDQLPTHARARLGIQLVPDRGLIFPNLTVAENLGLGLTRNAETSIDKAHFAQFPFLASHASLKAGRLSGGEKRILALTRALSNSPKLLLVDEFSEGLQPNAVRHFLLHIRKACGTGVGCILVVHSSKWAQEHGLCVKVMNSGGVCQLEQAPGSA